jgi:hypothetical protein
MFLSFKRHMLLCPLGPSGRGPTDMVINLASRVWASLGAHGPARYGPLANPGQAGTVPIRVGPSRTRPGPAEFAHLNIYI